MGYVTKFLSTPSARRATLYNHRHAHCCQISIHALREEGDVTDLGQIKLPYRISIHALREEGDRNRCFRADRSADFYPRPPRGGRPVRFLLLHVQQDFYPRPPRGGRPRAAIGGDKQKEISIHALREEGDRVRFLRSSQRHNFYPRPPRGGRRPASSSLLFRILFLSTPSARRATTTILTALRHLEKFLSTPSARRATLSKGLYDVASDISIHALREEGDQLFARHGHR